MIPYLVEFLGTFFFLSVIIATGQPALIALSLFAVMLLGSGISGGHFNPATSLMFFMKGSLSSKDLLMYVLAQIAGGVGALFAYKGFLQSMRNNVFVA
jgi:glycerol uptake facilitator-like aquaporin